jgi:haloalkane dehalogenase
VENFVGALGLDELTLVLNDLGGPVALGGLARKHPELIQGVVVAEAFGWSLNAENPKVARMLRMIGSAPSIKLVVATNLMALGTSTRFGVGRHLTRSARAAFRGPYRDKRVRRNALAMLGDGARADSFLQEVDQTLHTSMKDKPLLTVFGERSPTTKEGFPQQWRARFPGARQTVVKGGHHFPQMDDPSGVAEAIRLWWHECVAPSVYESGRG